MTSAPPEPTAGDANRPAQRGDAYRISLWLAWVVAAGFAILAAGLGQRYLGSRFEIATLRDQQAVAEFKHRSARNQLEAEHIIANHRIGTLTAQLAALDRQLKDAGGLARLNLATLTGTASKALGVAVWNPATQEGVLCVEALPALAANQDYQLWLADPQNPAPVSGGVFTVNPATGEARLTFHTAQPIKSVARFSVSLERKGGVPQALGPMVLQSR